MTRNDTLASLAVNAWINGGRVFWPKADLFEAELVGADLFEADLRGCDLSGCDLRGADLRGAKITLGNRTFTLNEETAR
jgi:uncharacterized protein YjbI with pentapeptide repeats